MEIKSILNVIKRPTYIDHVILSANTATTVAIPEGVVGVGFGSEGDFYAKIGDSTVTAAVPSSDVLDGSGSAFNPTEFQFLPNDTHISFISRYDIVVTLHYF